MFDQRKRSSTTYIWIAVAVGAVVILVAIQFMRVNPPPQPVAEVAKPMYTNGPIIQGTALVGAKDILTFNVNLNKRSDLKGTFTTGDGSKRIVNLMIKAEDMEKWKAGEKVTTVFSTIDPVPRGTIARSVEPGNYVLIFDNRANDKEMELSGVDFTVQ